MELGVLKLEHAVATRQVVGITWAGTHRSTDNCRYPLPDLEPVVACCTQLFHGHRR